MSEHLVADISTNRLMNWVLGVGSLVTGGLLLWIASTTHSLALSSVAVQHDMMALTESVADNGDELKGVRIEIRENTKSINELSSRVATLEHSNSGR